MPEENNAPGAPHGNGIEMPKPTAAPMILATGMVLIGAGVALNVALSAVGLAILVVGLAFWIADLLPGQGHFHEALAPPEQRPQAIVPTPDVVERMHEGLPGYRMRLPIKMHPISAGVKGGIAGGLLMPVPALIWALLAGHTIWYPVNLLAGMVWAGLGLVPTTELEEFRLTLFLVGVVIHAMMSLVMGLLYGVLLPTLPKIRGGQFAWGAIVLPMLWTGVSYGMMGVVNPILEAKVSWGWFIMSQFVFGVAAEIVVVRTEMVAVAPKGTGK
jgi:uncharacterized membrane protein YagU involved in acid resistance